MENSHTDFLQEVEAEIAGLKERIAALEEKLEAFKAEDAVLPAEEPEPEQEIPVDFTDMDLEADIPESPVREDSRLSSERPEAGPVVLPDDGIMEDEKAAGDSRGQSSVEAVDKGQSPVEADLPWRKDKPGMQVKNIRSGISLYDRALFIGTLFKEDFALYDKTIADLNSMSSLDQAVDYIREHFPSWNLKSDVVYNFMMAIRKKLG